MKKVKSLIANDILTEHSISDQLAIIVESLTEGISPEFIKMRSHIQKSKINVKKASNDIISANNIDEVNKAITKLKNTLDSDELDVLVDDNVRNVSGT